MNNNYSGITNCEPVAVICSLLFSHKYICSCHSSHTYTDLFFHAILIVICVYVTQWLLIPLYSQLNIDCVDYSMFVLLDILVKCYYIDCLINISNIK